MIDATFVAPPVRASAEKMQRAGANDSAVTGRIHLDTPPSFTLLTGAELSAKVKASAREGERERAVQPRSPWPTGTPSPPRCPSESAIDSDCARLAATPRWAQTRSVTVGAFCLYGTGAETLRLILVPDWLLVPPVRSKWPLSTLPLPTPGFEAISARAQRTRQS